VGVAVGVAVGVGVGVTTSHGVAVPSTIRETWPPSETTRTRPQASSPKPASPGTLMPTAASEVGADRFTERSAWLQLSP
jgi:hypothetical protein